MYAVVYHNRIWFVTPNREFAVSHARLVVDEQRIKVCVVNLDSLHHTCFEYEE